MNLLPAYAKSAVHTVDDFTGRVVCMDALHLLRMLPDASVDLIATDPPYNVGIDTWDSFNQIEAFFAESYRVLKDNSFIAFTSQMPHMLTWLNEVTKHGFKYADHVAWIKRVHTNPMLPLCRAHESLFIYKKGQAKYYKTKGLYTDVKLPGILIDAIAIDGVDRYIKDLQLAVKGSKRLIIGTDKRFDVYQHFSNKDTDRSPLECNFTNVWSFLPENHSKRDESGSHATQKPVLMYNRICELLSPENGVVCDPFVGSGTTVISCYHTGRQWIASDNRADHVRITQERLQDAMQTDMNTDPYVSTTLPNGMKQLSLFEGIA